MKEKKANISRIKIVFVLVLLVMVTGCSKPEEGKVTDCYQFTDSVGRQVEVPRQIDTVVPCGTLAQMVLYTACPDRLVGLAYEFTEDAKMVIDKKYTSLPVFGQFYGKSATVNYEAVIQANPDVVFDIGEQRKTTKEDMDLLQQKLGIPVVFIQATLETMDETYETLGKLLGNSEEMAKLGEYCKNTIDSVTQSQSKIPEEEKVSVYMALGDEGLNTDAKGSFHAYAIDVVGAQNIAEVEASSRGGGSQVSLEQIAAWNPQVILTDTQKVKDLVTSDERWAEISAVQNQKVYKIPTIPYNFIDDPPSVNRIIGLRWLGHLLYPQYFEFSKEDVITFYQLFYHLDVDEAFINQLGL